MLKHCEKTFDQNRRSRRNISFNTNNGDSPDTIENAKKSSLGLNGVSNENNVITSANNPHDSSFKCSTPVSNQGLTASTSFLTLNSIAQQKYSSLQRDDSRRSSYSTMEPLSITSRTSSFASLNNVGENNAMKRTPIKIYAKCLRTDIEYKTLSVSRHTTSTEVIWMLLSKFKMRHRDPKLFYLSMDIGIISHGCSSPGNRVGMDDSFTRTLVLEDDAYPAELKSCHPWGECRFTLQTRKGGLVRIYDSVLMEESKYKCLLISDMTTVNEVISILFHCYGLERIERVDRYELWEQSQQPVSGYERCLQPSDCPVNVQGSWQIPSQYKFVLRRTSKAFQTNTPLSTNSSSLSVTTSTSSLSSPRSSSVSPCSSTSSSVATTENMSMSLSPSSTNESEVYSANESDVIEEVDEEAMDTSYTNSYSPLSINSMARSSPSGASSSSISPSGSSIVPNLYSSCQASNNQGAPCVPSINHPPVLLPKPNQFSTPLPPPLHPHYRPFQTTTQGGTSPFKNPINPLYFNKSSNNTTAVTPNNTSLSKSQYIQNINKQYPMQNGRSETRGTHEEMNWNKTMTNASSRLTEMGHLIRSINGDHHKQLNPILPKANFNLNGPVSRTYPNLTSHIEQNSSCGNGQQQGRPSIHESGLPSLRPKPTQPFTDNSLQVQQQTFSSLNYRSHNTNLQRYSDQRSRLDGCNNPYLSLNGVDIKKNHVAFHEYENYFYI